MLGRTLSLLTLLGASTGLTLTRDENVALVKKSATNPATSVFGYPLDGATGIHVSENIVLAFEMDAALADTGLAPNPSNNKRIVLTATQPLGTEPADSRTIPSNDDQVSIHLTLGTGSQVATNLAFVTINPYEDLLPGRVYEVVTEAGAFVDWNGADDAEEASDVYTTFSFTTVGSCKDSVLTGTDTQKAAACVLDRDDCIWTGTACEASVIVVSGQEGAASGTAVCNGATGTQRIDEGVPTGQFGGGGCAATVCLNGEWESRGLRNGKPVYSMNWAIPLKNGGSRFQFEDAASAALTTHRAADDAGWVGVCGGAVRFGAPTESTAANPGLVTAATWTNDVTNAQADYAAGTLVVTEASCAEPTTAGYSFPAVQAGSVTRGNFAPTGISCASGYSGTVKVANCETAGDDYTVSGCSKHSRRRRKHKHNRHWHNNDAAAPFNPFWWFR